MKLNIQLNMVAVIWISVAVAACGKDSDSSSSCEVGAVGCPCTEGGGCDEGLTCASERCVDLSDYESDGTTDGDTDGDSDGDSDGDADGDSDGDADGDGDTDTDSDGDTDTDTDGDTDTDTDGDSDTDTDGDTDTDTDGDSDTDTDTDFSPGCVEMPSETFASDDEPSDVTIETSYLKTHTPWGYERAANADRLYPIVVNGCWDESEYFTEDVRKKYPAFYLTFGKCGEDSQGAELADLLDAAVGQGLRIDMNRVYLTGWSKGGSGSYKLVRGFLSKDKLFAAIVRIAGQSESELAEEAIPKTSIWYHIGLRDSDTRVQIAEAAYAQLKDHESNAGAVETTSSDSVTFESTVYERTTKTLTKEGVEIVKYTEYPEMGHVPGPPYADPYLFEWLFGQSLDCR